MWIINLKHFDQRHVQVESLHRHPRHGRQQGEVEADGHRCTQLVDQVFFKLGCEGSGDEEQVDQY